MPVVRRIVKKAAAERLPAASSIVMGVGVESAPFQMRTASWNRDAVASVPLKEDTVKIAAAK